MILIQENDDRFYLSKSTQPNAGMGVFAHKDLKAGDFVEIIGVMVKKHSIADLCTSYANNYKFAAAYAGEYDTHIIPMGFGGMINHANDPENQNAEIKYIDHKIINSAGGHAVYCFTRDIKKDEEILGNYGENWKNAMQWIQRIPKLIEDLEEKEWNRFLNFDLYNLYKLKNL
jgi:hypothetical protein